MLRNLLQHPRPSMLLCDKLEAERKHTRALGFAQFACHVFPEADETAGGATGVSAV